jgi:hypothetical protein
MGNQKQIRAQVIVASTIKFDETVAGLKNESELLRRALAVCSANDGGAIRKQTIGARSWAVYLFDKSDRAAHAVRKEDAAVIIAAFELAQK